MPQHDELQRQWRVRLREARAQWRPHRRPAPAPGALGEPPMSPPPRPRARRGPASATVQLAHPGDGAARALDELERDRPAMGAAPMALLRAGLHLAGGDLAAARPHVAEALQGRLARDDRVWLWLAYADAVSARGG